MNSETIFSLVLLLSPFIACIGSYLVIVQAEKPREPKNNVNWKKISETLSK